MLLGNLDFGGGDKAVVGELATMKRATALLGTSDVQELLEKMSAVDGAEDMVEVLHKISDGLDKFGGLAMRGSEEKEQAGAATERRKQLSSALGHSVMVSASPPDPTYWRQPGSGTASTSSGGSTA